MSDRILEVTILHGNTRTMGFLYFFKENRQHIVYLCGFRVLVGCWLALLLNKSTLYHLLRCYVYKDCFYYRLDSIPRTYYTLAYANLLRRTRLIIAFAACIARRLF